MPIFSARTVPTRNNPQNQVVTCSMGVLSCQCDMEFCHYDKIMGERDGWLQLARGLAQLEAVRKFIG